MGIRAGLNSKPGPQPIINRKKQKRTWEFGNMTTNSTIKQQAMKVMRFFIVALTCVEFYSCAPRNAKLDSILSAYKADTFVRIIPTIPDGNFSNHYQRAREFESFLHLPNIENGVDELEIRVWYAFSDTGQLVILKNRNKQWTSDLLTYKIFRERIEDSFQTAKKVEPKIPISGWQKFTQQLVKYNIAQLPDESEFESYLNSTPGHLVSFEIATTNFYRIYGYQAPELNQELLKPVDTAMKFLNFLEKEFQYRRIQDY
jgi:hypothetical protein